MLSSDTIYIQIFIDKFVARNVDSEISQVVERDRRGASPRMLIGDFLTAQDQILNIVKFLRRGLRAPQILMHPMELIEGGLTQVEHRVFVELGEGAGASRVGVYTGTALSVDAMKRAILQYKR